MGQFLHNKGVKKLKLSKNGNNKSSSPNPTFWTEKIIRDCIEPENLNPAIFDEVISKKKKKS